MAHLDRSPIPQIDLSDPWVRGSLGQSQEGRAILDRWERAEVATTRVSRRHERRSAQRAAHRLLGASVEGRRARAAGSAVATSGTSRR